MSHEVRVRVVDGFMMDGLVGEGEERGIVT